jgi:hypothetical protein
MVDLVTKRLILSPLARPDADDLFEVRGDPETNWSANLCDVKLFAL